MRRSRLRHIGDGAVADIGRAKAQRQRSANVQNVPPSDACNDVSYDVERDSQRAYCNTTRPLVSGYEFVISRARSVQTGQSHESVAGVVSCIVASNQPNFWVADGPSGPAYTGYRTLPWLKKLANDIQF